MCIVDSGLYISSVESGFWNMFLATIVYECSSHNMFTFNSECQIIQQFVRKETDKALCGPKAQSAFGMESLYVRRCFISPVTASIISKYLNLIYLGCWRFHGFNLFRSQT